MSSKKPTNTSESSKRRRLSGQGCDGGPRFEIAEPAATTPRIALRAKNMNAINDHVHTPLNGETAAGSSKSCSNADNVATVVGNADQTVTYKRKVRVKIRRPKVDNASEDGNGADSGAKAGGSRKRRVLTYNEVKAKIRARVRAEIKAKAKARAEAKGGEGGGGSSRSVSSRIISTTTSRYIPGRLCPKCENLNLELAFRKERFLGTRPLPLSGPHASCPLCQLFVAVAGPIPPAWKDLVTAKFSICSLEYWKVMNTSEEFDGLCNERTHCIAVAPVKEGISSGKEPKQFRRVILRVGSGDDIIESKATSFSGRIVRGDSIDYSQVKDWLTWCEKHHGEPCFPDGQYAKRNLVRARMRVIDCKTLVLCDYKPDMPYVALSYVWGAKLPHPSWRPAVGRRIPSDIPSTINDAITVTSRIGMRYLWVDQYCIDQRNAEDKARQIDCMGIIYNQSHLTIIAASGNDADGGLPGVSTIKYKCDMPAQAHGMDLVSSMARPAYAIALSRWAMRGWTYQEGVLANRRLIFTDFQVVFECRSMECFESVCRPLSRISTPALDRLRHDVRPGYFRSKCNPQRKRLGFKMVRTPVWAHAVAFNRRRLSFESDRLAAFIGILGKFGSHLRGAHINGVPIDSLTWARRDLWNESARLSKCSPHEVAFTAGLCWHTARVPCRVPLRPQLRRDLLPSYTWLGWTGPVGFDLIRTSFICKVYQGMLHFPDFRTASWGQPALHAWAANGLNCVAHTLEMLMRLEVSDVSYATLSIRNLDDNSLRMEFDHAQFRLSSPLAAKKLNAALRQTPATSDVVVYMRVSCIRLMNYFRNDVAKRTYLMLIKRLPNNRVERIGLLELSIVDGRLRMLNEWPHRTQRLVLQ